jgi:hypothetical protein
MVYDQYSGSLKKVGYYIYALCEIEQDKRIPFYIGRGKNNRCLQHLVEDTDSIKVQTIRKLIGENKFGIDILRHGISTLETAKIVEATCIDLLGVGNLTNEVRGSGKEMGRMSIEEIDELMTDIKIDIASEHYGIAFMLNKTYKSGMSPLALFESTRGIWSKVPVKDKDIKFAYALYGDIVKEVYEIDQWVKAGTQQYFTRDFSERDISERWEFVGKIADEKVRSIYRGKLINRERSFGTPFVIVGK